MSALFEGRFGNNALYRYTLYNERYAPAGCIGSEEDSHRVLKLSRLRSFRTAGLKTASERFARERNIWD